jgi:hypothetical protein
MTIPTWATSLKDIPDTALQIILFNVGFFQSEQVCRSLILQHENIPLFIVNYLFINPGICPCKITNYDNRNENSIAQHDGE